MRHANGHRRVEPVEPHAMGEKPEDGKYCCQHSELEHKGMNVSAKTSMCTEDVHRAVRRRVGKKTIIMEAAKLSILTPRQGKTKLKNVCSTSSRFAGSICGAGEPRTDQSKTQEMLHTTFSPDPTQMGWDWVRAESPRPESTAGFNFPRHF